MPYERPTLAALTAEAENDLAARLSAFDRLRRNVVNVLSRVWAGLVHGLYGFIAFIAKQTVPYTATEEYLANHAAWWGIFRKPAALAMGRAVFSGQTGAEIPKGAILTNKTGQKYITAAGHIDESGEAKITIKAIDGGPEYNLPAESMLQLLSPLTGVKTMVKIAENGLTGGVSAETDEPLRERLNSRVQEPPQGGNLNDYRQWALAVPGVTRAWPYGNHVGPGSVGLTFVNDNADNIIPGPELVAAVAAYINDPARKPITADIIVFAPLAQVVDITIKALNPNTEKVKAAVKAELAALFVREAQPGGTILVSHIREAISLALGEHDHILISPVENVTPDPMTILIFGEVHFVD